MYKRPLVPHDFVVPAGFSGPGFVARMLSVDDLIDDYDAVMSSVDRLPGLMSPNDTWPRGLTLKDNLIDLAWHQREFTLRHSFAYTLRNPEGKQCLGCCYIYPSDLPGFEVDVFYWTRSSHLSLEPLLGECLRRFLAESWPFRRLAFPGRSEPWANP